LPACLPAFLLLIPDPDPDKIKERANSIL